MSRGDRRANDLREICKYVFENKHGMEALHIVMDSIAFPTLNPNLRRMDVQVVPEPKSYPDFFAVCRDELVGVGLIDRIKTTDKTFYDVNKGIVIMIYT